MHVLQLRDQRRPPPRELRRILAVIHSSRFQISSRNQRSKVVRSKVVEQRSQEPLRLVHFRCLVNFIRFDNFVRGHFSRHLLLRRNFFFGRRLGRRRFVTDRRARSAVGRCAARDREPQSAGCAVGRWCRCAIQRCALAGRIILACRAGHHLRPPTSQLVLVPTREAEVGLGLRARRRGAELRVGLHLGVRIRSKERNSGPR
mmetsp:Transcript_56265/g.133610  ORF Transcript_56265/g.133610 Transcript_56265/m.133610 type:complete len:202 (+) Transcript_56265:483-1088(+)